MTRVAMLSMHTSPFAQLGVGHGGGLNVYVKELSEALARRGVDVQIFTASDDRASNIVDLRSRIQVHQLPVNSDPRLSPSERALEFGKAIRQHIDNTADIDILHAHYWMSGVAAHQLKHDLKIPLVSTFHTLDRVKTESGVSAETTENERAEQEAAVINCSDAVIASNLIEVADIRRLYSQDAPIEIVNPGIDSKTFRLGNKNEARLRLALSPDAPIALFAGRIQYAKGLDRAVAAFRQVRAMHPEAKLLVIGGPSGSDGERELKRIKSQIADLGLTNSVQFLGPQSHADLALYMQAADVCVVPSRTESFGLVALEAAACGTPVVASALGGLQFVVQHGRTGFLARDIDGLAGAMDHLFSEPKKAQLFGLSGAVRARSFTWDHTADQMLQIYDSLTQRELQVLDGCMTA